MEQHITNDEDVDVMSDDNVVKEINNNIQSLNFNAFEQEDKVND
jgi:hypothetical protein